jgi:hypothetical protein
MPRKHNKHRGGSILQGLTNTFNSFTSSASNLFKPKANSTMTGGRRRRRHRGGYSSNTSLTNLASTASPYSGSQTAQPHNWVGGRSRKRRRHSHRRRSHRRH